MYAVEVAGPFRDASAAEAVAGAMNRIVDRATVVPFVSDTGPDGRWWVYVRPNYAKAHMGVLPKDQVTDR